MFKNALVSVSDKRGLVEFIKPLVDKGMRVVSTGGTAQVLKKAGIPIVEVSEQTHFPEMMDGRVKTLHPFIHIPLLARDGVTEDQEILRKFSLDPFDLVVVNLYPFETALQQNKSLSEQIEYIDIGGPSLLRAAAKSYKRITVVCDPSDYSWIQNSFNLSEDEKRRLASKVFSHTSAYDSLIANYLQTSTEEVPLVSFKEWSLGGERIFDLRYGENPQQHATWYRQKGLSMGLHTAQILQGKPLSYNNLLDLEVATRCLCDFNSYCVVGVKHNNPCGIAIGTSLEEATRKALLADPISIFGGIIALSDEINLPVAELLSEIFLECIIAPKVSDQARKIFQKKKNLRILEWPDLKSCRRQYEIKSVAGGFLLQTLDQVESWNPNWQVIGSMPSEELQEELLFAWTVSAQLKSNAIAITGNGQTLGLGMGQVNRVEAVQHAIQRYHQHHSNQKKSVLASDAFFPFKDSIEEIARAGIQWIIQPGGSLKDSEVIARVKDLNINMILTGQRHFRH